MSRTKWVLLILLIVFVVIQFVRPDMTNPPTNPAHAIDSVVTVTPQVEAIFQRSCDDCHDNDTRWPWYSQVAPASWLLRYDVTTAKKNFSMPEFAMYSKKRQARKLQQLCDQVTKGDMPLWFYLPLHPAAKLTDADKQTLCQWAKGEKARIEASMTPAERAEKSPKRPAS